MNERDSLGLFSANRRETKNAQKNNKPALQWFVEREFKKVKDMRD